MADGATLSQRHLPQSLRYHGRQFRGPALAMRFMQANQSGRLPAPYSSDLFTLFK